MPKIHIYKKIHGSLLTIPGDSVLSYSGGFSARANAINGIFVDNPPVLPPDYASVIWRYYADTDRYLMVHVQGSHAVFPSQGRVYPYRAAFEVPRDEVNTLIDSAGGSLPLASIFAALPRIDETADKTGLRVPEEDDVSIVAAESTAESQTLAANMLCAFYQKTPLHVETDLDGLELKGNGILRSDILATVLSAIEKLPVDLARYATFALCVDERHAAVTDGVFMTVYPKGNAPVGVKTYSWQQLITQSPDMSKYADRMTIAASSLPGREKPLLPLGEMLNSFGASLKELDAVAHQSPLEMSASALQLWLDSLGHKVSEIKPTSWTEARHVYANLKEDRRKEFVAIQRQNALAWAVTDIDAAIVSAFGFSDAELDKLREKAFPLYWKKGNFAFLFRGKKAWQFLAAHVNEKMLKEKVGNNFYNLEKLVGEMDFVSLDTWRKAFPEGAGLRLGTPLKPQRATDDEDDETPNPLDRAPQKKQWVESIHKRLLIKGKPQDFDALKEILGGEADDDNLLLLSSLEVDDYRDIISRECADYEKARKMSAAEAAFGLYNELAELAHDEIFAHKELYKTTEELQTSHATMQLAVAAFCKEQMLSLVSGRKTLLARKFADLCDSMYGGGEYLWQVFLAQYELWEDDELEQLADFSSRLASSIKKMTKVSKSAASTPATAPKRKKKKGGKVADIYVPAHDADETLADDGQDEQATEPLSLKSHHHYAIRYIVKAIKSSHMSSDNKQKAEQLIKCSDERKMQFAQLTGKLPMSTGKRMLIYLVIAIIAGAVGFGACYIIGKTAPAQPNKDIVITLNENDNAMISIAHSNIESFGNIQVGDSILSLSDDNIMASLKFISDYTVKDKKEGDIQSLKVVFTEGEKKDTMQIDAQKTLITALQERKAKVTDFVIGEESTFITPVGEGDSLDVSSADYYLWLVRTIAGKAGKEKQDNIAY